MTSRDLASEAQIAYRTGRAHALKLVRLGIVDLAEVFPAHRYRLSDVAEKRNLGYFLRLCNVVKVFGIEVSTTEPEEQLRDGDAENA